MSSVSSIQKSVSNIDLSEGDSSPDKLNLSLLPSTVPSLCIPRVYKNISREKIMRIFDELKLGTVEQIDIISIKNGGVGTDRQGSMDAGKFNRVFIHMKWNTSENSNKVRERLLSDKEIKILYEDPWFWKVRANRSQNSAATTDRPVTAPPSRPKNPVLDFEDEAEDAALRQRKAQQQQQQQQHQKQYQPRQPYQGQGQGQGQPRNPPQDARAQRYWQQQEYENEHREFARRTPAYSDPRNSSTYDADKEYGNRPQKQQQHQQSRQYPRPPLANTHAHKAPRPVQRFRATSPSFPPPSTPPTAEAPQVAQEEKQQQQQQQQDQAPPTVEPVVSTEKDLVNGAIGLADASDLSFNNQNENQLDAEEEEQQQQQQPLEGADTVFAVDYGTVDPNITIRRKKRIVIKK